MKYMKGKKNGSISLLFLLLVQISTIHGLREINVVSNTDPPRRFYNAKTHFFEAFNTFYNLTCRVTINLFVVFESNSKII